MGDLSGALVLVATPIGNLGDLSPRAVAALADAEVVCCEDTRRTRALLSAASVPAGRRLVSVHAHNEAARAEWVADQVQRGATVVLVTDAGTPGVSDPGSRVVGAVVARGLRVTTVPGPSAALAALAVAGLPSARFCVEGFLPRRGAERSRRLAALAAEQRTTVVFEAPTRVAATLAELAVALGPRPAAVCRELTKLHEEVRRGTLLELAEAAAQDEPARGEVVLVVGGADEPSAVHDDGAIERAVDAALGDGASTRDAAATVAANLGVSRRRAYEVAVRRGRGARG